MSATPTAVDLTAVDLLDPGTFQAGIPHDLFRQLRETAPVWRHERPGQPAFWVLSRYADVVAALRDFEALSSEIRSTIIGYPPEKVEQGKPLIGLDPPRHTAIRKLLTGAFTPRAVRHLESYIRTAIRTAFAGLEPGRELDFVELVSHVPTDVIGEVLGVPPEDRPQVGRWGDLANFTDDPEFAAQVAEEQPWENLGTYAHVLADRPDATDTDLIPALRRGRVEDGSLSDVEFEMNFRLLVSAGTITTRDAMASAVFTLSDRPDQVRELTEQPDLVERAVEEVLRWSTPTIYFARTATRTVEIAGQVVPEGDQAALYFASANFDEAEFDDPTRFRAGRTENAHLAFGGGRHFCLGAFLARLELTVFLEEIVPLLPRLEVVGPPDRTYSHISTGIKRLPVRVAS